MHYINHLKTLKTGFQFMLFVSLGLMINASAVAFDELNEAQTWVYDTAHLSNTTEGQVIEYQYKNRMATEKPIEDLVSLSIAKTHDEGKRDVSVEFLTDERRLPLPEFKAFRGNPVIIATLEHIAQNLAEQSGGGVLYFRNRIRDALATDVAISEEKSTINSAKVDTTTLRFKPFTDDPRVGQQPEYSNAEFTIVFSDAIPGGVVSVGVESTSENDFFYSQIIDIR